MTRALFTATIVLLAGAALGAHQIDEYVQATRVAVSRDRITVMLDLTPGMAIAPALIDRIDRDDDHQLSPLEAEAYGREVLSDLTATLDEAPLTLRLTRVELPPAAEMRDGIGTIRVEAAFDGSPPDGRHRLTIRNTHRPEHSVYLANALLPADDTVRIARQDRDERQEVYHLEYELLKPASAFGFCWMLAGAVVLAFHVGWRRRAALAAVS